MHGIFNMVVQGGDYVNLRSMCPSECPLLAKCHRRPDGETVFLQLGRKDWGTKDINLWKTRLFWPHYLEDNLFYFMVS